MRGTVNQLARTLALANRFITEQLEQHGLAGIAPSHGDIFVQLFAHGELPMSELAQRIGRDPSTVTALVRKLAVGGYVSTAKLPEDKRVTLVALTERGRRLQSVFESISNTLADVQCRGLGDVELEALDRTLRAMQENFKTALEGEHA